MPQVQLPIFPVGTTHINADLAFEKRADQVLYFNGHLPVFIHASDDLATFRMYTSQLILNGTATQGQIAKAFGVPVVTVKRMVKRHRQKGPAGFYQPTVPKRGHKLTPERLVQVQGMLDQGQGVSAISQQLGVLKTTLHKAIDSGRLKAPAKKKTAQH